MHEKNHFFFFAAAQLHYIDKPAKLFLNLKLDWICKDFEACTNWVTTSRIIGILKMGFYCAV